MRIVEPGESGIRREVLAAFLAWLSGEGCGLFPDRFTLEITMNDGAELLHVSAGRGVIRPVVAEDSRKTMYTVDRPDFESLVAGTDPERWSRALENGTITST